MRAGRHRLVLGVVTLGVMVAGAPIGARAAEPTADVDDPKMARVYEAPRAGGSAAAAPGTPAVQQRRPVPAASPPAPVKRQPAHEEPSRGDAVPVLAPKKLEPAKPVAPPAEHHGSSTTGAPRTAEAPAKAAEQPVKPAPVVAEQPAKVPTAPAKATVPPIVSSPPPPPAPASAPRPAEEHPRPVAPAADVAAHPPAERSAEPPARDQPWPYAPRLKLAYRRFAFARVASASAPAGSSPEAESFESVSLDLYPMSWFLRVGLSTQFGWESEKFDRSGDYFIAETASVGVQWPGRFTPFVEALAGAGYMRRTGTDWNLPTAFWQVGIDAGVEIYVANRAYVSLAAGYLHPGNLFVREASLMSVKTDTWSLKFGVGI